MFDTLEERIKHDEAAPVKVRIEKALAIGIISVLLFGGLYFLVRLAG
jgi:hypothetical protein